MAGKHYLYDAQTLKEQIPLARYLKDQGVPLFNGDRRAAATWRGGDGPTVALDEENHQWYDHKAAEGGSIIELYMALEGAPNKLAAMRALGDRYHITPKAEIKPPRKVSRGEMLTSDGYRLVETYTYTDADGKPLYYVDRYEKALDGGKREKSFVQRTDKGDGIKDVHKTIYNLPAVTKADRVFLVEGEKDVETMRRLGLVATTNSGGGKFWESDFDAYFEGKDVAIIPDNDEVGVGHAETLAAHLHKIAKSVKIVKVSKLHKGDVTDYIEREGGTLASLMEMVAAAPLAIPTEDADVLRAKELNREPLANWEWGEPIKRGEGEKAKTRVPKIPRHVDDVCEEIRTRFLAFPRRLGSTLFDYTRSDDPDKRTILKIDSRDALKAWVNGTSGHQSDFEGGGNFASWAEVYERLHQTATSYEGLSHAPWFPPRADVFPIYPVMPPPDSAHKAFWAFVDFFNPATAEDRLLIAAFAAAPMYYLPGSARPAWCVDTTDAQGSGKTTVVNLVAALYGETPLGLDMKSLNNDINQVKKRILSAEGRTRRIALFDNLTESFKGANIADFVTSASITGMAPYGRGEETRANDITWTATMNGGTVDTDMATRTYKIMISKPPKYDPKWEERALDYIAKNRMQILADVAHMLANARERIRSGSRFAKFDATVLSAVCGAGDDGDAAFTRLSDVISERAKESNEEYSYADELREIILSHAAKFAQSASQILPEGHKPLDGGRAWIIRVGDLNTIISRSNGAIRGWKMKRVRTLIKSGISTDFDRSFERINSGEMRRKAGVARAVCFFPSATIPRHGNIPAQLFDDSTIPPTSACDEYITLG